MHSATTATGRANRALGETAAQNRPAPSPLPPPAIPPPQKPHATSRLHCYKHRSPSTNLPRRQAGHESPVTNHVFFNRQPARLEIAISPTKQTPAPQFNRQQFATSRISNPAVSTGCESRRVCSGHRRASLRTNLPRRQAGYQSPVTNHSLSNRQSKILEFTVTTTKQTIAPRSNRQYFQVVNATNPAHCAFGVGAPLDSTGRPQAVSLTHRNISNRNKPAFKNVANSKKPNEKGFSNRNTNAISLASPPSLLATVFLRLPSRAANQYSHRKHSPPPTITCTADGKIGISMYRCRTQLMMASSITTTITAAMNAQ